MPRFQMTALRDEFEVAQGRGCRGGVFGSDQGSPLLPWLKDSAVLPWSGAFARPYGRLVEAMSAKVSGGVKK